MAWKAWRKWNKNGVHILQRSRTKSKNEKLLKSFVQFVILLSSLKKCVPHLFVATSSIRWYRCHSWGNSGCIGVVFGFGRLSCRSNLRWFGYGWKKVYCRGLLRGWVLRMGIRGAGQDVLIVAVASIVGELSAGVLEGLVQRSGSSLQQ